MGAAWKESVPAGVGSPTAPKGTKDWADNVRGYSRTALDRAQEAPQHFAEVHDIIVRERAWSLMNRPDGSFFTSIEEFAAAPRPYGWGRPYATVRPFLEIAESKRKAKVAGVSLPVDAEKSLALAEVPGDGRAAREHDETGRFLTKDQTGPVGTNGKDKRIARIARDGSGDVKDLFRAGLISDRAAAALSPVTKGPEVLATEEKVKAVVAARGAPATPREKRATKREVEATVKAGLAKPVLAVEPRPEPLSVPATITEEQVKDWLRRSADDAARLRTAHYAAHLCGKAVA